MVQKGMAKNRSLIQRHNDRKTIADLHLKGWSKTEIARYLEVAPSTVTRDVEAIQKEWKASAVRDYDLAREEELQKLRLLEKEYWLAWERSQSDKETSITEQLNTAIAQQSGRQKIATRTETKSGEVAYLNGIGKCIAERSKLLGLYLEERPNDGATETLKGYLNYLSNQNATINPDPDHTVCE